MTEWSEWVKARTAAIDESGRLRAIRDLDAAGPAGLTSSGREVVSFASNDYLGLTQHPAVKRGALEALERWGAGAGSARLIVGSRPVHSDLERAIAEWKDKEAGLLFPTGFSANLGVLAALAGPDVTVCSDELNHASIIDGCRLARADVSVYPHKDLDALEEILASARGRKIVISDSVFSMDGDIAPVEELTEMCGRYEALLILDEAHAVLGPHPVRTEVERLRVGTLSKFLGSSGGFVAGDAAFIELILNTARPFIFTTATPPASAGAALAALGVLRSTEGEALVALLRRFVDILAPGHPSPIIPFVVGDENDAVDASHRLEERGFLVPAIRPPSVPKGTSRLRVTVSAAHTEEQVRDLLSALGDLGLA